MRSSRTFCASRELVGEPRPAQSRRCGGIGPAGARSHDGFRTRQVATAIASWWTLLHDLVTSFLGAIGVIDQRHYEDALSAPTVFRTLLWILMIGYLTSFVLLYSKAIAAAQRLPAGRALLTGATAFVAYQLLFLVFNR